MILCFLSTITNAQLVIDWQKCYGGSGVDEARSVQKTTDGGFIVAGKTNSYNGNVTGNHGGTDIWVIKLDSLGNLDWQKCLGGALNEIAYYVIQTNDNGFAVTGSTNSNDGNITGNHGGGDCFLIKLDSSGLIQWQKCYGGTGQDGGYSVQQTSDNSFIISGYTNSYDGDVSGNHGGFTDCWVIKTDSLGNLQWQKCIGGSAEERGFAVQQTTDNGYIINGHTQSTDGDITVNHGNDDYMIVKLDSLSNIEWQKCYGGTGTDNAYSILEVGNKNYIVSGFTNSTDGDISNSGYHGNFDYWIIKIDSLGYIMWKVCLGGSNSENESNCLKPTPDGGFVMVGSTSSNNGNVLGNHGSYDVWVVKIDSTGSIQWQKCLGGTADDYGYSIDVINNQSYVVVGTTYSNDGDVSGSHGDCDFWIVKLTDTTITTGIKEIEIKSEEISIYPNPTSNYIIVSDSKDQIFSIFNSLGSLVMQKIIGSDNEKISLSLANGIYFYSIFSTFRKGRSFSESERGKIIIIH